MGFKTTPLIKDLIDEMIAFDKVLILDRPFSDGHYRAYRKYVQQERRLYLTRDMRFKQALHYSLDFGMGF